MTRFVVSIALITGCVLTGLAAGPFAVVAVAAAGGVVWYVSDRRASTSEKVARGRGSARWLAAGVAALAGAVGVPLIDGGELRDLWWSVMALLVVGGVGLVVTGLVFSVSSNGPPPASTSL